MSRKHHQTNDYDKIMVNNVNSMTEFFEMVERKYGPVSFCQTYNNGKPYYVVISFLSELTTCQFMYDMEDNEYGLRVDWKDRRRRDRWNQVEYVK